MAPRGVILNEHILGRVASYTIVWLSDYGGKAINCLRVWNILRSKVGLKFADLEVADEYLNVFNTHAFDIFSEEKLLNELL